MPRSYDVVIAGAGLAGCAAAITLGRLGLRTLAVEKAATPTCKPGESLPPASRRLLRDLDILPRLHRSAWLPIHANLSCWESSELTTRQFVFDPDGPGWRVDRARLDAAAQAAARAHGSTIRCGASISALEREDGIWTIDVGEERLHTSWLIDATGRRRVVARRRGASVHAVDHQVAIFARYRSDAQSDRDTRTLVEATENGWFYTALLPGHDRIVVFHTDPDLPAARRARAGAGFGEHVGTTLHVREVLGEHGYAMAGDPRPASANSARLDRVHGEGWLAVGDAATSFDPLSSQGMHTAMYSGLRGAEHLARRIQGERTDSLDAFADRIGQIYATHLRHRRTAYRLVQRWPTSAYWSRRSTVT